MKKTRIVVERVTRSYTPAEVLEAMRKHFTDVEIMTTSNERTSYTWKIHEHGMDVVTEYASDPKDDPIVLPNPSGRAS